ncbi:Holliday junction resolvase RuvX, partial [Candidatus Uhrbacteria bacterium]|nr:Holliday junction resolvase RuvX [Candidatus Uhrbacteria bacterium]
MRILGVDFGTKRTGLAVGDAETLLAFPLRTVSAPTLDALVVLVLAAAAEEKVERVVVGMPVR